MPIRSLIVSLVATAVAFAAPIPGGLAAKDIREVPVAADALVVFQLNGYERTKDRLLAMISAVSPQRGKDAKSSLDEFLKSALEGRDLAALDGKGRIFASVEAFEFLSGPPHLALFIPVTSYADFKKKLLTADENKSLRAGGDKIDEFQLGGDGNSLYAVDSKDGYAIVTPVLAIAEKYAGKYDRLAAKTLGPIAETVLETDFSLFFHLDLIAQRYKNELDGAKNFLPLIVQQAAASLTPAQATSFKAFLDGLTKAIDNTAGFAIAFDARPEGFDARFEASLKPDNETSDVLKDEKPGELSGLLDLPGGYGTYTAAKLSGRLLKSLQVFLADMHADEPESKAGEAVAAYLAKVAGDTDSLSFGSDASNWLSVNATKEADATAKAYAKALSLLGRTGQISNLALKDVPKLEADAATYGEVKLSKATIHFDFDASVPTGANESARAAAIAAMKAQRAEVQSIWFGSDGKNTLTASAKDWEAAKAMLEARSKPKAKLADDKLVAVLRKQLPAKASYLAIFDAKKLINDVGTSIGDLGELPVGLPAELTKLKPLTGDRVFLGTAIVVEPNRVRFEAFIPVAVLKLFEDLK